MFILDADFNLEIFNYAIHELLKLESKRKKLNKKEQDCCGFKFEDEKKGYFSSILNINTIVKILFLLIVLLIFFEMSKKSGFLKNIQYYFQKISSKNK